MVGASDWGYSPAIHGGDAMSALRWIWPFAALAAVACSRDPGAPTGDPADAGDGCVVTGDAGCDPNDAGAHQLPDGGYVLADGGLALPAGGDPTPNSGEWIDGVCTVPWSEDDLHGCCGANYTEAYAVYCGQTFPGATPYGEGTCQGLRVVQKWFGSGLWYCSYGEKGALVGVRGCGDTDQFCGRSTNCTTAGTVPRDCECAAGGPGCPLARCTLDGGVCVPDPADAGDGG
jgi:hypothetical protein